MNIYLGVDNGTSGSYGVIGVSDSSSMTDFFETPSIVEQNYTKKDDNISRVKFEELLERLQVLQEKGTVKAMIERPFMTPIITIECNGKRIVTADMRFLKTSLNAHRAYEATLNAFELMKIEKVTVDSKAWQKRFLPGVKGSKDLKAASKSLGRQRWPMFEKVINSHGDADGLFIADYCRLYFSGGSNE